MQAAEGNVELVLSCYAHINGFAEESRLMIFTPAIDLGLPGYLSTP